MRRAFAPSVLSPPVTAPPSSGPTAPGFAVIEPVSSETPAPGFAVIAQAFRLPLPGWPRALFESGAGYEEPRLSVDGACVLRAAGRADLARGTSGTLPSGERVAMQLTERGVVVSAAGKRAVREDRLFAKPSRTAWIHAIIALAGSAAGLLASARYLARAAALAGVDPAQAAWAEKMGLHMAGWHLLLTVALFPASVWGQRPGIRVVQAVSLVFCLIHAGIALANLDLADPAIAALNAASGLLFAAATVYGQRAHRDMDPLRALVEAPL